MCGKCEKPNKEQEIKEKQIQDYVLMVKTSQRDKGSGKPHLTRYRW